MCLSTASPLCMNFFLKKSHNTEKKTEREDPLGFFNIHSVAKLQKIEGGPLVEENEKSHTVPKKI